MFGHHIPESVKDRAGQSVMAAFSRGIQAPGRQWRFSFPNGFGASVINDGYGAEQGRYELGVLHNGHLTYQTPITDDVLGYLTEEQVTKALDEIAALTPEVIRDEQVRRLEAEIAERRKQIEALMSGAAS